jgi:hypothetical protein
MRETWRLERLRSVSGVVIAASEVQSVEPEDESVLGLVHRWIVVTERAS